MKTRQEEALLSGTSVPAMGLKALKSVHRSSGVTSGAAGPRFSESPFAVCRRGSGEEAAGSRTVGVRVGGLGSMPAAWPWADGPQNEGFLLSSRAILGLSFGLVACVVALVLGLCFAHEFLVSGRPLAGP